MMPLPLLPRWIPSNNINMLNIEIVRIEDAPHLQEYFDERPDQEYFDERLDQEYCDERPGQEYFDERPDQEYFDERPDQQYSDKQPDQEYCDKLIKVQEFILLLSF